MTRQMKRATFCGCLTVLLFSGCGSNGGGSSSTQSVATAAPITYQLAVAADTDPNIGDGSFIAILADPISNDYASGSEGRLSGTFQVVPEAPASSDIVLEYRVVGVDLLPASLPGVPTQTISVHSGDVGLIQLHKDGTLDMELQIPFQYSVSFVFDLSRQNSGNPGGNPPNQFRYSLENGQLILRGVLLQTASGPPYYSHPVVGLYASPVS